MVARCSRHIIPVVFNLHNSDRIAVDCRNSSFSTNREHKICFKKRYGYLRPQENIGTSDVLG